VVGHVALGATVEGGGGDAGCAGVRAWAACAARDAGGAGAGVAAVAVNFCGAEAALDFGAAAGGAPLGAERREWVLTPGDAGAGLASKSMRLNGALHAAAAALCGRGRRGAHAPAPAQLRVCELPAGGCDGV
jgi:hypothetical protein